MTMSAVEADRMFALAAQAGPQIAADPLEWAQLLSAHHDELSDTVRWFIATGNAEAAVEMAANLRRYWQAADQSVLGRDLCTAVLGMPTAPRAQRYAELRVWWARFVFSTGGPAGEAYESALAAARERGDTVNQVESLVGVARVAARDGRLNDIRTTALEALELAKTTGDGAHQRAPVHALAAAARMMGDYQEARERYQESIDIGNALGMSSHAPPEHHNLGYVELHSGNLDQAERMFELALHGVRRFGLASMLPYCVLDFGVLAIAQGAVERGAVLVAAAKAAFDRAGTSLDPDDHLELQAAVKLLSERIEAGRLATLSRRGEELSVEHALSMLSLPG